MRRVRGSFWTPERDRRLQAYEAGGLTGAAIAERLGTTRNAVLGRSQRLRGLHVTYKAYVETLRKQRAANAQQQRRRQQAVERMQAQIAKGIPQSRAIMAALRRGAMYQAIGDAIGVSKQRVQQIAAANGIARRKKRVDSHTRSA
jgi:hypothetical protein